MNLTWLYMNRFDYEFQQASFVPLAVHKSSYVSVMILILSLEYFFSSVWAAKIESVYSAVLWETPDHPIFWMHVLRVCMCMCVSVYVCSYCNHSLYNVIIVMNPECKTYS